MCFVSPYFIHFIFFNMFFLGALSSAWTLLSAAGYKSAGLQWTHPEGKKMVLLIKISQKSIIQKVNRLFTPNKKNHHRVVSLLDLLKNRQYQELSILTQQVYRKLFNRSCINWITNILQILVRCYHLSTPHLCKMFNISLSN